MTNEKIKILLVEDNDDKRNDIVSKISKELDSIEFQSVSTVKEALACTKTTKYDLLVVDLVIPIGKQNDKPHPNGGITLIDLLEDSENKPNYIIGISSFIDIAENQQIEFAKRSWHIIHYDKDNEDWKRQILILIEHIGKTKANVKKTTYGTDVFVITALRKTEMEEVISLGWNFSGDIKPICGKNIVRTGIKSISDGTELRVAVGSTAKMGLVWTSVFTLNAIDKLKPKFAAMTGICMGQPNETAIGDVIVAVHSWNWQAGKFSEVSDRGKKIDVIFEPQPEPIVASGLITKLFEELSVEKEILERLHYEYKGVKPDNIPKIKVAPMVSGSAVVSSENLHNDIFSQDRKIRGVDMETFGFYAGCEDKEDLPPLFISLKAVSDFGTREKDDRYQNYCAHVSAKVLDIFIDKYWAVINESIKI